MYVFIYLYLLSWRCEGDACECNLPLCYCVTVLLCNHIIEPVTWLMKPVKRIGVQSYTIQQFHCSEALQAASHRQSYWRSYRHWSMPLSGIELHDSLRQYYNSKGRQCGICGRHILGTANHLSRHVAARHTGASHILVRNLSSLWRVCGRWSLSCSLRGS